MRYSWPRIIDEVDIIDIRVIEVDCDLDSADQAEATRLDALVESHLRLFEADQKARQEKWKKPEISSHARSHKNLYYRTWNSMRQRCYNPNNIAYKSYGARGIEVCQEWHDFDCFVDSLIGAIGPRPEGMTLDRTNNNGNYGPYNVRWATRLEQVLNSRRYLAW